MERDRRTQSPFRPLLTKLLLFDAEARARRLGDGRRRELRLQVALARQKVDSASALWASEQYVEALRLIQEAIVEAQRAVQMASAAWIEGEPPTNGEQSDSAAAQAGAGARDWLEVLPLLGATPNEIDEAKVAALGPLEPVPMLNSQVTEKQRSFFRTASFTAQMALRRIDRVTATPASIVATRWLLMGLGGVALVGVIALLIRSPAKEPVEASAVYDNRFQPHRVVDGDASTEWLLPNLKSGWIQVTFPPQKIKTIKVLNGQNPPHGDRSSKDIRIEAYDGKKVVHTSKHTFAGKGEWVRVPVAIPKADVVKVYVDSHNGTGGGLAEVAWE